MPIPPYYDAPDSPKGSVPMRGDDPRHDSMFSDLKNQVFRDVLTYILGDRKTIEPGIDLILISRHLERIGDHATNIAEDAIFLAEARDVRHGNRAIR